MGEDLGARGLACLAVRCGNPAVEWAEGCVVLRACSESGGGSAAAGKAEAPEEEQQGRKPTRMACIYDVPPHVTIGELHDLLARFEGAAELTHARVVANAASKRGFTLLLRFREHGTARVFRDAFDGRRFNSLEEDACRVALVERVRFCVAVPPRRPKPGGLAAAAAAAAEGGRQEQQRQDEEDDDAPCAGHSHHHHSKPSRVPHRFPSSPDIACAVCLEPVEPESSPIITVLCNHVFHFECLSKWADSTCPVCRYIMQPAAPSECDRCGATDRLWICLICGHVGCGRYVKAHAVEHFEETGHTFSLDVITRRVWDYVEDDYVHRVVQNKADGKLIGVSRPQAAPPSSISSSSSSIAAAAGVGMSSTASPSSSSSSSFAAAAAAAAAPPPRPSEQYATLKLEEIVVEYNYLLSSQLETQRTHFQRELAAIERDALRARRDARAEAEALGERAVAADGRARAAAARRAELEAAVAAATRDIEAEERATLALRAENKPLLQAQRAKRSRLQCLEERLCEEARASIAARDAEIADLEMQIQEMAFHIKTRRRIDRCGGEIEGGQMFVFGDEKEREAEAAAAAAAAAAPPKAAKKKKNKKKKKKK